MKRRWLIAPTSILAVIVLAMALWLASPAIMVAAAKSMLARYGIDAVDMAIGRPGATGVRIEHLDLRDGDSGVQVALAGVDVEYRLPALVRGAVEAVTVEDARIVLAPAAAAAPLALPGALPGLDPGDWLRRIPPGGIAVERLVVDGVGAVGSVGPFRAQLNGNATSALLLARPAPGAGSDRMVELVADRGGRINGALAYEDPARAPALEFHLVASGGEHRRWDANLASALDDLADWLLPWYQAPVEPVGCGVAVRMRISENPLDALAVDAEAGACRVDDVRFTAAVLTGRFMRTATGVASVTPLRLTVAGWQSPAASLGSLAVESGVDVDLGELQATVPIGARARAADVALGGVTAEVLSATLGETMALSVGRPAGVAAVDLDAFGAAWGGLAAGSRGGRADVAFAPGTDVTVDARLAGVVVEGDGFRARLPSLSMAFDGERLRLDAGAGDLEIDETSITATGIEAELPIDAGPAATLSAQAGELAVSATGYRARLEDAAMDLDFGDVLTGRVEGSLAGLAPVTGSFNAAVDGTRGTFDFVIDPVVLGEQPRRASALVEGWPEGIDLVAGTLAVRVDGRWDPGGVRAGSEVELSGGGGVFDEVYFSDLATRLVLDVFPELRTREPARVTVGVADYGITVTGIDATVELSGEGGVAPRIAARDVRGSLFGGTATVPGFDSARSRFEVLLDDIDLAALVGEGRFPGLSMTGRVGGRVPVDMRDDGFHVEGGVIENTGPGVLHYDPGDVGSGGGVDILFRSLRNFEFDVLRATPDYRPDGTLVLGVHMEGTSEEIGRQQPIHFNINVEQNVLQLFESLRLVGGLNERIDRGVKEYYERRSP